MFRRNLWTIFYFFFSVLVCRLFVLVMCADICTIVGYVGMGYLLIALTLYSTFLWFLGYRLLRYINSSYVYSNHIPMECPTIKIRIEHNRCVELCYVRQTVVVRLVIFPRNGSSLSSESFVVGRIKMTNFIVWKHVSQFLLPRRWKICITQKDYHEWCLGIKLIFAVHRDVEMVSA